MRKFLVLVLAVFLIANVAVAEEIAFISVGDYNEDVIRLHQKLSELGLYSLRPESPWGPASVEAVKALQRALGKEAVGNVFTTGDVTELLSTDVEAFNSERKSRDLLHTTITIDSHDSSGVTYTGNLDGSVNVQGKATDTSFYNIYLNKSGLPEWLHKGTDYLMEIYDPTKAVTFEIYLYNADEEIIFPALVSTYTNEVFRIPDDAEGIIIRFRGWQGRSIATEFYPTIREY